MNCNALFATIKNLGVSAIFSLQRGVRQVCPRLPSPSFIITEPHAATATGHKDDIKRYPKGKLGNHKKNVYADDVVLYLQETRPHLFQTSYHPTF